MADKPKGWQWQYVTKAQWATVNETLQGDAVMHATLPSQPRDVFDFQHRGSYYRVFSDGSRRVQREPFDGA